MNTTLKLNEFKALYKTWKTNIPYLNHLLLGVLVFIENILINNRVKVELDEAIKEWEDTLPPPPPPIYTETPSATSTSLPEMRLRAPWVVGTDDTAEGRSGGS
jgi:hypothetical protein